ncbi:MAG: enolase [Candidatus Nitrosotenuis sp.]|uniref:Enolase n=1 Tax=Candidatus Nitrosotenuis uzonensis TaxID=1407055 RepID=V6ARM4_9ARCH|nr:enolase [Candidatus Nitrosotenuis uzonensis]CAE6493844.1 Enolase [Candidatus Nitrosotenuis uzonensis]CDI05175.1 Enolase [Candidatus Nitrosotenuis uzonensis]
MPKITSVKGRLVYNSRGSKTIEIDIISDKRYLGRACAPSGASVGKYEAQSFADNKPEKSLQILNENIKKFIGLDSDDLKSIQSQIRKIDNTPNYSKIGGAVAYSLTIAATDSAAKALDEPMFKIISQTKRPKFPFPLGNILGGGAHAGPGTPDIQEILICSIGAKSPREAIERNFAVHRELGKLLQESDSRFTNGRGDEGGWAPQMDNEEALEISAKACERLGYTLGKEVALGVDFASSTQWDEKKKKYVYERAGFENTPEEQIDFASNIIKKYKLIYAEDAVHEEAFSEMAIIRKKFPRTYVTGDDLTVTNPKILKKAIIKKSCSGVILKVNQAGSLYDALEFAQIATKNKIGIITSHRSGESTDHQISHIGVATGSKMLKVGVLGGERVSKLNELIRLSEHSLISGMAEV